MFLIMVTLIVDVCVCILYLFEPKRRWSVAGRISEASDIKFQRKGFENEYASGCM